jgi:hypothetical protein
MADLIPRLATEVVDARRAVVADTSVAAEVVIRAAVVEDIPAVEVEVTRAVAVTLEAVGMADIAKRSSCCK